MARPFHLEIPESLEYLENSLHKAQSVNHKEKLQMLVWLKRGQVTQHQQIAQRLDRNPSTITRWLQHYRQGGLAQLLATRKAPGRAPVVDQKTLAQLEARLAQPEGFKSYGEVQQWLEQTMGQSMSYKTVHKTVRYRLKAKLKVPRPQSIKQDPQALETFKKTSHSL